MSQNSLTLPTTGTVSGLQQTQNMNNALDTLNTLASGASAPASPEAGQLWHDITTNTIKLRALDNAAWIALFSLNEINYAATPYTPAQAGYVNKFRNPSMDIAQRGTSGTATTSGSFTLDGWIVNTVGTSCAWAQAATGNAGGTGCINGLKITGAASVTGMKIAQRIESFAATPLTSQTVTVSAWIYNKGLYQITHKVLSRTG